MKRGGPIKRTADLPRYGSRLRSVSAKRAAKAGQWAHLRALVHAREGGCCARCRTVTPITIGEAHHRKTRARGGWDTAENCVWLCFDCHHAGIHDNPDQAGVTAAGWLVPSYADPASWPCLLPDGHYWQPGPDGWSAAEPREEQTA